MSTLNVRLAAILLVCAVVIGGAVAGLHRYQVWRNADIFLDRADEAMELAEDAREDGKLQEELAASVDAERNYGWYLGIKPGDIDVRQKLGLLQADLSQMTRNTIGPQDSQSIQQEILTGARRRLGSATQTLERVLREDRDSDRRLARRRLVETYIQLFPLLGVRPNYSAAKAHLTVLLDSAPEDAELLQLLGTCQQADRQWGAASESFQRAIKSAPDRVEAYRSLVGLLANPDRLNRPDQADLWMRKMLQSNPDSCRAHWVYGRHLTSLTGPRSIDDARKRPIFLDAIVPAVLAQAVEHAVEALKLAGDDPDALLLAKDKAVLVPAVRQVLVILYDVNLPLDDPNALLLSARRAAGVEEADSSALNSAMEQVLKGLQPEDAPGGPNVLSVAAKHGVLIDAMKRARQGLGNPGTMMLAARKGLLEKAAQHSLSARQLAAQDRDALLSLFLREFSPQDHAAVRLADQRGVLLAAVERALDNDPNDQVSPAALGRTARRVPLLDAVKKTIADLKLPDDGSRVLNDRQVVLVDLIRHALRDCEPASNDRDVLLQTGKDGVLARVAKEALAGKHGVFTEAVKNALKARDASAGPLTLSHEALRDELVRAIQNVAPPQKERDVLLRAAKRGPLVRVLKTALADSDLVFADRDKLLKPKDDQSKNEARNLLSRVVKHALQESERTLENIDGMALLLVAQCALSRAEYDEARQYINRGIELYPKVYSMYSTGAVVAARSGRPEDAIDILELGWEETKSNQLLWTLATHLLEAGETQAARVCIRDLQKFGSIEAMVGYFQARAEFAQGQWLAAVSGRKQELLFDGRAELRSGLDAGDVSQDLRQAFRDKGISLADDPSVAKEGEDRWTIIDKSAVYEVTRQGNTLNVYRQATRGFEENRAGLAAAPSAQARGLLSRADHLSGMCYERLGYVDQAMKAYRRALDVDPDYVYAKAGLADVLTKTGQIGQALIEYRGIVRMPGRLEQFWLPMAQALVLKNRQLDPSQQDWKELEALLAKVSQISPKPPQLVTFQANRLVEQAQQEADPDLAQQKLNEAEKMLTEARDRDPDELQYWTALVQMAGRKKDWDRAELLLDEAQRKLGDSVSLRVARAAYFLGRHGREAADQLKPLAEETQQFSEGERLQLWTFLGRYARQVDDYQHARQLWRKVAQKDPNDLDIRIQLLELAIRLGDDAGIKETLREVETVEGKGPRWNYGEAIRLQALAKGTDEALLNRALKHINQTRKSLPKWSKPVVLAALIYHQQGKPEKALVEYLRAIKGMGSRNPIALVAAVELLHRRGGRESYEEAAKMLRHLEDQHIPFPDRMIRVVSDIKRQTGDLDGALELAVKAAADSDDFRDHLMLARIRAAKATTAIRKGQTEEARQMFDEAEQSLRRVVDLAEDVPETWVELIRFLAGTGQTKKAEDALQQARGKIPPDQLPFVLARCYEGMGRLAEAEQYCEEALAAAPQDPAIARYVADFYLRNSQYLASDPGQRSQAILRAEAILSRIIGGEVKGRQEDVIWARRQLALTTGGRGGYQNLQKALGLIEENLAAGGPNGEDLRTKATILALDSDPEKRKQATQILENLPLSATAEDRFRLCQLYLAQGSWSRASSEMRLLLADHPDNPAYLVYYISALLARNNTQDAESWLTKLEKIAPYWFSPRQLITTTHLRTEWLFQRKEYAKALALMNRFVGRPGAQPPDETDRSLLAAGALEAFSQRLTELDQNDMVKLFALDAETLFQKYVTERPRHQLVLAMFLQRRGRYEEALSLLESVSIDSDPTRIAQASLGMLDNPAITEGQLQRVEKEMQKALKRADRSIPLLLVMAQMRVSQQQYGEAEDFYRQVIRKNSGHFQAMNNLAVLLALQKTKLNEALKLVNQAIQLAGPTAPILDSRASVYMALGQPGKALDDLNRAIVQGASPVRYFHQAQARQQNGQRQAAMGALKQAQKLGLEAEILDPLERPAYQELLKLLK